MQVSQRHRYVWLLIALFVFAALPAPALRARQGWAPANFIPQPPFTSPAQYYSGISGPGTPVGSNVSGGWRSGPGGVTYQGPDPKPGWHVIRSGLTNDSAVRRGLIPPIRPLLNLHLRDTIICLGGDGFYYMTGSSGDNIWDRNDGVELWRSADLVHWKYLGLVWSIRKDGTWEKRWRKLHQSWVRTIWAPELHYIHHNYYICLAMAPGGVAILKSTTGKAEGPYINALKRDRPLVGGIDPTLFQDTNGNVYFSWGGGTHIVRMKRNLSGFAGRLHTIKVIFKRGGPHPGLDHGRVINSVGQEGVSLFKRHGWYYLGAALFYRGRYSSCVARSRRIYGPYTHWQEAVPCGGGGDYFRDKSGRWWCTFFGNDTQAPWREKPGIIRIIFSKSGRILLSHNQPFVNAPPWHHPSPPLRK